MGLTGQSPPWIKSKHLEWSNMLRNSNVRDSCVCCSSGKNFAKVRQGLLNSCLSRMCRQPKCSAVGFYFTSQLGCLASGSVPWFYLGRGVVGGMVDQLKLRAGKTAVFNFPCWIGARADHHLEHLTVATVSSWDFQNGNTWDPCEWRKFSWVFKILHARMSCLA